LIILAIYLSGPISIIGFLEALLETFFKFRPISIEYSLLGVVWGRILSRLSTKVTFVTATYLFHFHTFALSENCCDKLSSELGSVLA